MSYTTVLALHGRLCKGSLVRGWGWVHHTLTHRPKSAIALSIHVTRLTLYHHSHYAGMLEDFLLRVLHLENLGVATYYMAAYYMARD